MPKVKVDWIKCKGEGVCVDVCPVDVFELQNLPEYPGTQKSVFVRADDCILCMACVNSCPTEAITVKAVPIVRDVMTRNVKTVGIDDSVEEAVQKMNKINIGSIVVVDKERRPLGIVTERDVLRMVEQHLEPTIEVKKIMSTPLVTIDPNSNIAEVVRVMTKKRIKRLPVIENDRLVGIITSSDVMRASPKLLNLFMDLIRVP